MCLHDKRKVRLSLCLLRCNQEERSGLSRYDGHLEGKLPKAGEVQYNATRVCCGTEDTTNITAQRPEQAGAELKAW